MADELIGSFDDTDAAWIRLTDQLGWYRKHSAKSQLAYKRVKLCQITVGATVPIVAALSAPPVVTAILAGAVVVAEGAQQLFQWHANWLRYRATTEALKREKFLFLSSAGPYEVSNRNIVLAERVEAVVNHENTDWLTTRDPRDQKNSTDT